MTQQQKDIVFAKTDLTELSSACTKLNIIALCITAKHLKTASVCVPPCYVSLARELCGDAMKVCTVVGFPLGYTHTESKVAETLQAISDGADEIDMVANISYIKSEEFDSVLRDIKEVRKACGDKVLKVIIETCLLTQEEKTRMCRIVSDSGADYIKTSTGFASSGATAEDVVLLRQYCDDKVKVKAAGGIRSISQATELIALGADRIGSSGLREE